MAEEAENVMGLMPSIRKSPGSVGGWLADGEWWPDRD